MAKVALPKAEKSTHFIAGVWLSWTAIAIVGAVAGTLGGAAARARLAAAFGTDRPAAIVEDAVALLGAVAILALAR